MSTKEVALYNKEISEFKGIGKIIRQARNERILSVKKLALTLGVNRSTIQHWEHSRRLPNAYHALQLSTVLHIPLERLCKADREEQHHAPHEPPTPNQVGAGVQRYYNI